MFKGASIKIGLVVMLLAAIFVYFGFKSVASFYAPDDPNIELTQDTISADSTQNLQPVLVEKPKKNGLLHQIDEITFSYSLKERTRGIISRINYFNLVMGKTETTITDASLRLLGYTIHEISECLFHVTNDNYDNFVMCPKVEEERGFFNNLTGSVVEPI
jgi:hypothetical protein